MCCSSRTTATYFNPRSSCEERPPAGSRISCYKISIHAPHARSDDSIGSSAKRTTHFNPRSSCEERPPKFQCEDDAAQISIHAPHARSDRMILRSMPRHMISIHAPHARSDRGSQPRIRQEPQNFNPRSSCEERRREPSPPPD